MPILIGGGGEKVTLRITAQHADLWNALGPFETWARKNTTLDEWCARIGRDPREIERTVCIGQKDLKDIDRFLEAGATHVIYGMGAPFDFGAVEELLAWRNKRRSGAAAAAR